MKKLVNKPWKETGAKHDVPLIADENEQPDELNKKGADPPFCIIILQTRKMCYTDEKGGFL